MSNTCSPAPSPVGPREEEFLEIFFTHISNFAFDKAKELAEKERDSHKASFGSSWGLVVHSLCFFALAEKTYMSLTFLGQKWFGRAKDNPRNSYSSLMLEFKKVEENVRMIDATSSDPTGEIILAHICGQLCQFLSARLKCMDFYEQMSMMGTSRNLSYEDLATIISDLIQSNHKSFHHPVLSSLKSSFSLECEITHHLLVAQIRMTEWQFLPSLLQLHEANSKLSSWGATALAKDSQSKKSAFGGISLKQSSLPALYQWLVKFKGSMLAKFTLYFYETLAKQSSPVEMKGLTAKTTEDYVAKIISFQKKSDASNILLVLDIQGIEGTFKGPGYHHPNKQSETPKGLDSYPAMFTYPSERPAQHWPTVVMMINDKAADSDKPVCTYDKTKQSTYFITRVDHRISLVVIFECKKSERDSYVNSFMTDMHSLLKGVKLFASLKPGMKG